MTKDRRLLLVFLAALTLAAQFLIVSIFPYEYRDSDSSCYSALSQKLTLEPLYKWCAPQWWGHGGNEGLFLEHPPGILWLPALLIRLGVKAWVAALCANFIYILLSLAFIFLLARRWGNSLWGWGAVFGIVLTPIFLQYLIRANQEHPLNLAVLAGIYGLDRSRESKRGGWLFIGALLLAVFIKGVSVALLSLLAVLYWLVVSRNRKTFYWIVVGHLAALGAAGLFEVWYQAVAGQPFWSNYFSIQGARSLAGGFDLLQKAYNVLWYAARILWFAAPWTFFFLAEGVFSKKRRPEFWRDRFLRFFLFGSAGILLAFALSDRKADRYIFPAYILIALAGLVVFLKNRPNILEFLRKQEQRLPWILSLTLVVITLLRIFFHSRIYRFIRFWPQ
jgi:4-amino-4-deoxy-L-arabinose transferase-like glycosyltransferase